MAGEQARAMLSNIENIWQCFDELFESIEASGSWGEKHGDDWTFADVPYHMMYFDRELVAKAIERGEGVPREEQRTQRTLAELNAWNAEQFAQRPAGQTAWQSVEAYRAMQERVRTAILSVGDEHLGDPVWIPLVGCGWVPTAVSIASCLAHSWSEFVQLCYLMGRSAPEPDPDATYGASSFLQNFLPAFMDMEAAKDIKFTFAIELTGPGGSAWTFRVADGACETRDDTAPDAQMIIRYSTLTSELIRLGKLDFGAAMESGAVEVVGPEHLETFGRLFPEPALDTPFPPMGPGALD
jgi:hypothetical protein